MEAVIAGAGLGGLAVAAGLRQHGWRVTVVERAPELRAVGAGLAVAANGLRALDTLGVGDRIRALAAIQGEAVVRTPGGRVLTRTSGARVAERFGDPIVLAARSAVLDALRDLLPAGTLRLGTAVTGVDAGRGVLITTAADSPAGPADGPAELHADLVIAADGINSVIRRAVFPDHPGPAFSGFTAWRMLVPAPAGPVLPGETWGAGRVFGIMPLADGRIYAYAADHADRSATQAPDTPEAVHADLLRRFAAWHDPIPALIAAAPPETVLHNDVYELATPLPAYHVGAHVALLGDAAHAMTPHLGQGGNQAFEDAATLAALAGPARTPDELAAALRRYSDLRVPRGTDLVRRSHRIGDLTQTRSRAKAALRDAGFRALSRVSPDLALRAMDPVVGWRLPTA